MKNVDGNVIRKYLMVMAQNVYQFFQWSMLKYDCGNFVSTHVLNKSGIVKMHRISCRNNIDVREVHLAHVAVEVTFQNMHGMQ